MSATVTQGVNAEAASARGVAARPGAVAGRTYVVELIGTFFLVFTVGTTALQGAPLAPLAIGAVLMVMIYAGGHLSGGHYNPAVTMAALVRRRISAADSVGYWTAQTLGGILAALVVRGVIPHGRVATLTVSDHIVAALVAEFLFTFALCYVVLNVATSKDHPDNSFYGLAIGFTVVAGAVAVGGVSGGAFNPAVALGACIIGLFAWSSLWLYLVTGVVAGVAAGLAFRALNPTDT